MVQEVEQEHLPPHIQKYIERRRERLQRLKAKSMMEQINFRELVQVHIGNCQRCGTHSSLNKACCYCYRKICPNCAFEISYGIKACGECILQYSRAEEK